MSRSLLSVLAAWFVLLPLNGVFHAVVAAPFFDARLAGLAPAIRPMHDSNPAPVVALDLLIAVAVVALGARRARSRAQSAAVGATLNLLTASAWNLANASVFAVWPVTVALVDVTWHVALGALAGWVAAMVLGARRSTTSTALAP
jgi:uncharacterized membrane protein